MTNRVLRAKSVNGWGAYRPIASALFSLLALSWLGACVRAEATPATRATHATGSVTPTAEALLARGVALLRVGDGLRAEQYLSLAVRAGAAESRAIVPLVQACVQSARLQSALEHALPYLRRHPELWELRYLVAAIQLALGRDELALAELERVRQAAPQLAGAHYLAAVIARDRLRDERATSAGFAAYVARAPHGEHAAEARAWLRDRRAAEPSETPGGRP